MGRTKFEFSLLRADITSIRIGIPHLRKTKILFFLFFLLEKILYITPTGPKIENNN